MHRRSTAAALAFLLAATLTPVRAQEGQLLQIQVHGASLEGDLLGDWPDRDVLVWLPASYDQEPDRRYPVLYLLHGYCPGCDGSLYSWWFDASSYPGHAGRTLGDLVSEGNAVDMILVAPDVDNACRGAWYGNSVTTGNWRDFIARDLIDHIDASGRTIPDREHRGIAGHSMGGNGAFRVAFHNPDVFGAVYGMAGGPMGMSPERLRQDLAGWRVLLDAVSQGVTTFDDLPGEAYFAVSYSSVVVPNPDNPPFFADYLYEDVGGQLRPVDEVWERRQAGGPATMVHTVSDRVRQLRGIYIDVGLKDGLLEDSRILSRELTQEGVPHVYEEFNGDHSSDVRRIMRERVLPYFSRLFQGRLPKLGRATGDLGVHVAGQTVPLRFELTVDDPPPATGLFPDLVLDLSALGEQVVDLAHDGAGHYRYSGPDLLPPSGIYALPVRLAQEDAGASPLFVARLQVFPHGDLRIVEDGLAAGWMVESTGGAEAPVPAGDGPMFAGERSLAVAVTSSSFPGWQLDLQPPNPIEPFGYTHLRFAFHPGTLEGKALNLNVGGSGVKLVDPRLGGLVDLERREWQVVEIALADISVFELFDATSLNGTVQGTRAC